MRPKMPISTRALKSLGSGSSLRSGLSVAGLPLIVCPTWTWLLETGHGPWANGGYDAPFRSGHGIFRRSSGIGQHPPDHGLAHAAILELQRGRDLVAGKLLEALRREIVAPGVAQQDQAAGVGVAAQPG